MYIAIDIGGTKTEIAAFNTLDVKHLPNSLVFPTPTQYSSCLNQLQISIEKLKNRQPVQGIGISIASRLSSDHRISSQNNLPDYQDHYLDQDIMALFACPVNIANDAACAALAEITYGAGQKAQSLIHFILGTGFGGTYVHKISPSPTLIPLEPGSTVIQPGGMPHTTKKAKGLFESYLGGSQLEAQLNLPLTQIPDNHIVWRQVANYLTLAVFNFSMLFNPEMIIFSGGLIQKRAFIIDQVKINLNHYPDLNPTPILRLSKLLPNASLLGALTLIK